MAEPRIDVDGLPFGVSGPYDTVVGVDEATGAARRFPMPQPGTPRSYATLASLPAASGFAEGYTVWVNNDPTPANNGTWAVLGGVWVQSADRVSGLEGRVAGAEGSLEVLDDAIGSAINDEFLWGVIDSLGKLGLALRSDGTLQARFRELLFHGGEIDPTFSTIEGDIFALVDRDGRMALQVTSDGTLKAKLTTPEIITARGSSETLDARLSRHLTSFGLPRRHVFGEWYLRETRQRLRKRAMGESSQLVVASIGDSWTHGSGRWTGPVAAAMKSEYGDAGAGYVSFASGSGIYHNGNVAWNSAVTYTGAWDYSAYATSYSPDIGQITGAAGAKVSYGVEASPSAVSLYAHGGAGVVRYRFNGGAWTTVDLSALSAGVKVIALNAPAAGVFEMEVVSGSPAVFGIDVHKSASGVRWHKLGATGTRSQQWAEVDAANWKAGLIALAPNLVTIMHGTNDQQTYGAEVYRTHMQTIITRVREALPLADILLIAPCENGSAAAATRPMAAYAATLYELAAINRCAYLDLQFVFGESFSEYSSTSPRAWFNADNIHPEPDTGGRAITDAVMRLLTQL